jgi:hypothetical protein
MRSDEGDADIAANSPTVTCDRPSAAGICVSVSDRMLALGPDHAKTL